MDTALNTLRYFKNNSHLITAFLVSLLWAGSAAAFTFTVVDGQGVPVTNYRWIVQEDTTYKVVPGAMVQDPLSVRFHRSYAPVIAAGNSANPTSAVPSTKPYFLSVLPDSGFAMGGASVEVGQNFVQVVVQKTPIPTAQISVFVFEDSHPINNAPDLPQERGLGGFSIQLFDAGGRYGVSGGRMSQDAFGNPLGTTYANGNVLKMGDGTIKTDSNGVALIQNLVPGKYTIQAVPPAGQDWHQTATIEGTKGIDAWVKGNEPPFFVEFGPPGHHVFLGFVHTTNDTTVLNGTGGITGRVVNLHNSRPPNFTFWPGEAVPSCWVGLNHLGAGAGRGVYVQPCRGDSTFDIRNVPAGNYQLVIWDENLDVIFALQGVTVTTGQSVALGDVPVFNWFARLRNHVFMDRNGNGFRDCTTEMCHDPVLDDVGIPDQAVNIRFRDGSLYQSMTTDMMGEAPFEEVFPFFTWLVAEVDFARFKATGATVIVDAGGQITPDQGWAFPSRGVLNPQPQKDPGGNPLINPNTGNNLSRTETGPVLVQAFQAFMGQTNVIEWGKMPYAPGENGGISGIVHYATTRAENDPRYAVADPWEPGIPRVQVNLYRDSDSDGVIDDLNGDGSVTLADVDHHPFAVAGRPFPQTEDLDRNANGVLDLGDAVQKTYTDSWDDAAPSGCQGETFYSHGMATDCYDGLRNFNQVRNGVFDGGYAFNDIPAGNYIVEAVAPRGYLHIKEQDKNVDFGEEYQPNPAMLPPVCVGEKHTVPAHLSLFPNQAVAAPFARKTRPLCDRKQVVLTDGKNAGANFFLFTEVPVAAQVVGKIVDDLANEFDPNSPSFGEKYSPPFIPISIRDWTGKEITRVYSDEWGSYNAMLPSTFTMNVPMPSGASPNMLTACLNSPGPIPNPAYVPGGNQPQFITDPFFTRNYSQFCYTFQYLPGTTTYLDTPVVPIAAFAGPGQYPVDCEFENGIPKIWSVSGPQGGPYLSSSGQRITIVSEGKVAVPNPAFDPALGTSKTIQRDYGFGTVRGSVTIGTRTLRIISWDDTTITAEVPLFTPTGQLHVKRGDNGKSSITGVTVTIGSVPGLHRVRPDTAPGATPIQNAIDLAQPGDLILVAPGNYEEMVVMWKPVRLQGWGAGSTIINAISPPAEKLRRWREKVAGLVSRGSIDLLPGQAAGPFDPANNEPALFNTEEGPAILVAAKNVAPNQGGFGPNRPARIDGFTITGASHGGGIFVNGYAHYLEINNNRVIGNYGTYGGGIRLGHPYLTTNAAGTPDYVSAQNDHVRIRYNHIAQNGGNGGAGGGISVCNGSNNYLIFANYICGNFTMGDGGGIGHLGLSHLGEISWNWIVFNQSFNQGMGVSGGGITVQGNAPLAVNGLSPGSGSVGILSNLIQGNLAGAGDGGGIRTAFTSGRDVALSPNDRNLWYNIEIYNNFIVNNVAGLAGGGISMQDSARISITSNSITNNDSTATAGEAFRNGPSQSVSQVAGIVSRTHSPALAAAFGTSASVRPYAVFSNPTLYNSIVWHNRSFYWDVTTNAGTGGLLPAPATPVFSDLAVLGAAQPARLDPRYCNLTDRTGYHSSNISAQPAFVSEYFNGGRGQLVIPEVTTGIESAPAFDEGGNFIDVRFGPLTRWNPATGVLFGDYRLTRLSELTDRGAPGSPGAMDIGADEFTKKNVGAKQ